MSASARRALLLFPLLAATTALSAPLDQKTLEARFDAGVNSADQVGWLKSMSSEPNHVGSPHDKANAEASLALFKSWGWDAHIEQFDVLYPTPVSTAVEIVGTDPVTLGGQEPAIAGDSTSGNTANALPPYVAYQGDGDVTADVVYVNYGMPADYEALARQGVDVKGKIVIARYGGGWRGLKPLLAQWHGAAGCLIYSDPNEDGYRASDPYPKGGARPPAGVQRGSVDDMPLYPGDPLTPGVGATPGRSG